MKCAPTFAILLLVMCFASGVVIKLILRPNAFNAMALSFVAMLVITGLDFIFSYL